MKIAIVANTGWYIYNFRRNLIRALEDAGHQVVAVSPCDPYVEKLKIEKFQHRAIPLGGSSLNPLSELKSVIALASVMRSEAVDVVLTYTPKGNIYGGLATFFLRTHQIANISGLGRAFTHRTRLTSVVSWLYRVVLGRAHWTFFQNDDDRSAFIELGIVQQIRSERIPGSGVDLGKFQTVDHREAPGARTFLMIARLLWDKGVGEFVEAARLVRERHADVSFQMLGSIGADNPSAVPSALLDQWVSEGVIEYRGMTDDVRPYIEEADCVVLPSYREGVPRSLLEAAAMERPVITTDSIGCRDAVDDGISGFLCRPRDSADLAARLEAFLSLSPEERREMGRAGRRKMEREFDERIVISRYLDAITELAGQAAGAGAR